MTDVSDGRRRTDLEIFILALVESGLSTPYDLQKGAGLSQGATTAALRRLRSNDFVSQALPGPRGRIDYKITAKGTRYLRDAWMSLIEEGPSGDLDADLRVALLAIWIGRKRQLATKFLRVAAGLKRESIAQLHNTSLKPSSESLADWYRDLRSASIRNLLQAEAESVLALAESLPSAVARQRTARGYSAKRQK